MAGNYRIILITLALITAISALGLSQWRSQARAGAILDPENQQMVAMGKALYGAQCASCHGDQLQGQPEWKSPGADGLLPAPPHDETGHTWHHSDELLFRLTKSGLGKIIGKKDYKTNMPVYRDILKDEEIIAVLSYIKASWPKEIQARHDQLNAQAAKAGK